MKIVTIDLETSGIPPKGANYETDFAVFPHILGMAWKINDGKTVEYIINNPGVVITQEITKINGITQAMCDASHYTIESTLNQFYVDCQGNDYVVGHNIYFDTSIIKANCLRAKMPIFEALTVILDKEKRIDTMRAGTKLCGKWPKLTELYMKLFQEDFDAHSAGQDVEACYKCFVKLQELNLIVLKEPVKSEPEPVLAVE